MFSNRGMRRSLFAGAVLAVSLASSTAYSFIPSAFSLRLSGQRQSSAPNHFQTSVKDSCARRTAAKNMVKMGLDVPPENSKRLPGKGDIIQDFLTQRSIQVPKSRAKRERSCIHEISSQTLMHNMKLVGDMESLEFLESFMNHEGLSNFHGYGALRTDSATYISSLRKELPVTIIKRKKFYRGGSRNNPYVTDNEITYTSTVQPRVLGDNIVAMREVLAKEWITDLAFIEYENAELVRAHAALFRGREDHSHNFNHPRHDDPDAHSPLRIASYDLLEKLVTEAAVRRVTDSLSRGPSADRLAGRWLNEQFHGDVGAGFRGDHGADVGRTFMRHLLSAVPVIVAPPAGASPSAAASLVDPHDVAERVMAERQRVAERWIERLGETPKMHMDWTIALLKACLSHPAAARSASGPNDRDAGR